jgi:Glycosyltransferase family 92
VLTTVFIILLWVFYFVARINAPADGEGHNSDWLASFSKPARHAHDVIVDFVSSTTGRYKSSDQKQEDLHDGPRAGPLSAGAFEGMDGLDILPPMLSTSSIPSHHGTAIEVVATTSTVSIVQETATVATETLPFTGEVVREQLPDPPPTQSPTRKRFFTLATMVKNQRRFIREWVEFHRMMGAEHFIFYDNDSTDGSIEVVQHYIDEGIVDWIPWPPKTPTPPYHATTQMEDWQERWFQDALATCLYNDWTIHKQGPCQLAAFLDAIRRTNHGVSRWLGIWDIDEFIFPRPQAGFTNLAGLLKQQFDKLTHIRVWGLVFGTSGHVTSPTRKPGSPLQPLLIEEYTHRAPTYRMSLFVVINV